MKDFKIGKREKREGRHLKRLESQSHSFAFLKLKRGKENSMAYDSGVDPFTPHASPSHDGLPVRSTDQTAQNRLSLIFPERPHTC